MTPDLDVDRLVQDAARALTAGKPPAALRAHVRTQLDTTRQRRQPLVAWMPLAAAATIACAIGGTWIVRQGAAPALPRVADSVLVRSLVPAGPAAAVQADAIDHDRQPASLGPHAPVDEALSEAQQAWQARAIPALQPIDAVTIDPIQPEDLSIPQLEVKPIAMPPSEVVSPNRPDRSR